MLIDAPNCYRPRVHYTAVSGWINDPNGLIYDGYTKTYHLFAQYSKDVENNGIFGWIHATSKDLLNWVTKDIPVLSNDKGDAWSGGAVIDYNNTSGLFIDSVPPESRMMLFVTYQTSNPKVGILYSLDHGETWIEYDKFVIKNENNIYTSDLRDPKVIWYKNDMFSKGGKWLLIIGVPTIKLFSSDNLLDWKYESEVLDADGKTISSECPDILKLPLDNNPNNIKYVVSTAGTSYIVGNLLIDNGRIVFKGEQENRTMFTCPKLWTNKGELYATQSFYNDRLDRTILMSWIVDRTASKVKGKDWNGIESLPLEVKLVSKNEEIMLNLYPIKELNNQRKENLYKKESLILSNKEIIDVRNTNNNVYDLELEVDTSSTGKLCIYLANGDDNYDSPKVNYDCKSQFLSFESSSSEDDTSYVVLEKIKPINNLIKLRLIVDVSIVDIYVNDGENNLHGMMLSPESSNGLSIEAKDGSFIIKNLEMYAL